MELAPCSDSARETLLNNLKNLREPIRDQQHLYVIKTFPNIMVDIGCRLVEQATSNARAFDRSSKAEEANLEQLTPFFVFGAVLDKSPQISSLIYNYFEDSSFQPLPEESFNVTEQNEVVYTYPGFNDKLVRDILITYFKYLTHNPKWFSAVWNWSELGRFIAIHPHQDIRYLATCCLSIITRPSRSQHIMMLQDLIREPAQLIHQQLKHDFIYRNLSKPVVETKQERITEFLNGIHGWSEDGQYHFSSDSIAKIANVLMPKRDISSGHMKTKVDKTLNRFVPVSSIQDTVSRIAYAAAINKPCLIRGPSGSGKTSILDYIAAHTNRVSPPDYVKVQVGDQIDSKSLVGSYVCADIAGQFEWRVGPLAQAMLYGSWIVFEDIDSAPAEMAQVIHSVIENGNLSCVSSCPIKLDNPHPDFKIFFTQRTRASTKQDALSLGFGFIERLCSVVDVPELSDADLSEILEKRYRFGQLRDTILKIFRTSQQLMSETNLARQAKAITLRDLFKFCDRVSARNIRINDGQYSNSDLDNVLADAIDCFIASLPAAKMFGPATSLGQLLNKPQIAIDSLLQARPTIREEGSTIIVGRAKLETSKKSQETVVEPKSELAPTRQTLQLMERVSQCINNREPALLVGETGVGKTTVVQHLANLMNTELIVINLSQQSDSADLLGGYRPIEMRECMKPIHECFLELFAKTYDSETNKDFLAKIEEPYMKANIPGKSLAYLKTISALCGKAINQSLSKELLDEWTKLFGRVRRLFKRISSKNNMALAFSDGSLVTAVRRGHWILLDEINLAEPDVLQCLLIILDSLKDSRAYLNCENDNSDVPGLFISPKFRIFACMNPSTDIGKRDLPIGVRGRFTELFFDDIDDVSDLRLVVNSYVGTCLKPPQINGIVNFYKDTRELSPSLSDVCGNSPVYSLRTLCRALRICAANVCMNMEKSLLESFKIAFLQQLNQDSEEKVIRLMDKFFMNNSLTQVSAMSVAMPRDSHQYVQVEKFWVQTSSQKKYEDEKYILTKSVKANLEKLSRVLSLGQRKLPILIQGNTAVGKTSLVKYLARLSGNRCYRINNHEHTDLEEYVGKYDFGAMGELKFNEGLLVTAMKKGYWVILDELNLAPNELLEALNRVLDDNRELFIPETGEKVKAHSKFVLFATQNPPEEYAGRKLLSRAFRNRFIELHFDDLPHPELEEILHKRCSMAPTHAKKIVSVMKKLQHYRRESGCFGGKNSFMTMRDLFRWGQRYVIFKDTVPDNECCDWDLSIASEGLVLLEGRVRTSNEADIVKGIIEEVFFNNKRKLDRDEIYFYETSSSMLGNPLFKHIHFTPEFKRMFVQLSRAMQYNEPALLCGQTGCGKTTACQLFAQLMNLDLITYNCHLNTESSDFVGSKRPNREVEEGELDTEKPKFTWYDGPLVQAMKSGSLFLMDEISLADDAVLERINSVLEPERIITLTENDNEEICAAGSFRMVATMNPGGDYGKKELSPALRNRFTEIYCHNTSEISQIVSIIEKSLQPALLKPKIAPPLIKVMRQFLTDYYKDQDLISLRDILSWTKFLNKSTNSQLTVQESIINGACLVFFDQFGTCGHKATNFSKDSKTQLMENLERMTKKIVGPLPIYLDEQINIAVQDSEPHVDFGKFRLRKGPFPIAQEREFIFDGPTVKMNAEKIVRALQLNRPVLLEGDPGAGKTSIVAALARMTGHKLVRINLSEQTDISDLFGSDLPDVTHDSDDEPHFSWHDGPMLRAIRESSWILLDEMNLASQSVLEGLNACFDHRGEIYIPEINMRFKVDKNTTRIFACQNPYNQGAARKGLPQSFLNRFTSIYISSHTDQDLMIVLKKLYPDLPSYFIEKMISFNRAVSSAYSNQGYEFNLRDLIYWCDLTTGYINTEDQSRLELYEPERFVQFVYIDRMRSLTDKADMCEMFEKIFGYPNYEPPYRDIKLGEYSLTLARSHLLREQRPPPHLADLCILKYQMPYIESIAKALEMNRMPILVGEPGVGKRSMLKILAGLTGNVLNIIGANRDMDTVELLGSYEQKSLQREMVELVDIASKFTLSIINTVPRCSDSYGNSLKNLFKHIWSTLFSTSLRDHRVAKNELVEAYRFQLAQLEALIASLQPIGVIESKAKWDELKHMISRLKKKVLFYSESAYTSGNFEWIDSLLVKSIKEGNWLMIENANLMNPATLDRLNSLVEPNGTLSLSEKGSGPDGIESIKPHKNFRLILTMNPDYGELSRAMRNRGVEIYVRSRFYFEDFLMLLYQVGFQIVHETSCMNYCIMQTSYDTHVRITEEKPEDDGSLLAYFVLNYSSVLAHQIRRGVNVDNALSNLLMTFYHQKGYLENHDDKVIKKFIHDKMADYKQKYVVDKQDNRYKWLKFVHDLRSMTGGDAIPTAMAQERQLLREFSCPIATGLLKFNERIENFDIVHCCTSIKIFMEYSSPADFLYRINSVKYHYNISRMVELVDSEIGALQQECLPMITHDLPADSLIPPSDMFVDTRNSPDFHYTLMCQSPQETKLREDLQNRWILSLYRINLTMITELIQETSLEPIEGKDPGTSLWALSEKVRLDEMLPGDLIRPQAKIVTDLFDLLNGLTRLVGNRCIANALVPKMMGRLFWVSYFSCKLKRALKKEELIAICNQIPMLWALTYQKVIVPLVGDCKLSDSSFNGKKISSRIKHICEFLDVSVSKPDQGEKQLYTKVINRYASTSKRCETRSREVDKFFSTLLGKYTLRLQVLTTRDGQARIKSEISNALAESNLVWSNSNYMQTLYRISDILVEIENIDDDSPENIETVKEKLALFQNVLINAREEYVRHEQNLIIPGNPYREKCLAENKRRCALDQFSPVWQTRFIHRKLSKSVWPGIHLTMAMHNKKLLHQMTHNINGLVMSPRYLSTVKKFLMTIERQSQEVDKPSDIQSRLAAAKNAFDMYSTFLVDHMLENIVLDNQIVGWMKLRVTTSDLSSTAPLIPEYSPIISLVSSYCLDVSHLKLNAYKSSSPQLDSMLAYLWRAYSQIKLGSNSTSYDLGLAKKHLHLRMKFDNNRDLLANHKCKKTLNCGCIDAYCRLRVADYDQTLDLVKEGADREDRISFLKAFRLIHFGFHHHHEYAPMFSLDPALRSREKMDVYKAELAHIKVDLQLRNTLHYWKSGENLRLLDIQPDEAKLYPFSSRALIERRVKLEKSLNKLSREFTNRPKSDDGALYYELRKEVQISIARNTNNLASLVKDFSAYLGLKNPQARIQKLSHLNTKCRMLIKTLEKSINRFKCDYILYSDITTQYLTGLCFMLQGMRLLHSRLEQKLQLREMGFNHCLVDKFAGDMMNLFSFSNFKLNNLQSVDKKRALYPILQIVCPEDKDNYVQSTLLRSILIQMNHHIKMTPSDIKLCIPIVRNVANEFHKAWLGRKKYLEEQRKKREDLYQYKTTTTTLGQQVSFEHKEFLDVVNRFPLYDHVYQENIESLPTNDRANLETEAQLINLNKIVDLTMCVDVCKAHYKFMKEASLNLLGSQSFTHVSEAPRNIDIGQLVKLETEIFYTMTRNCFTKFDTRFDSLSLECHLLQANELIKILRKTQSDQIQVGSLRSSIEILDEDIFDIYHSASPYEALRFQELLSKIDKQITSLRVSGSSWETHLDLSSLSKLTSKISSFLITDPLMKFVTGAHTLLQKLENWNRFVPKEVKMIEEANQLIELIHAWRAIEVKSWQSSLHRVKRKYIDDTLCDLWFKLYDIFNDPVGSILRAHDIEELDPEDFYIGFASLIKNFLEDATLGDYQIRLDLVFAFAIQTRFAGIYDHSQKQVAQSSTDIVIDYEKLTTYVYNVYQNYQGLMSSYKDTLSKQEAELSTELQKEIRIVNWHGTALTQIKHNFRISHRKLNKVMNTYLEVLRKQVGSVCPTGKLSEGRLEPINSQASDRLATVFEKTNQTIAQARTGTDNTARLLSLVRAPSIVKKSMTAAREVFDSSKSRYVDSLRALEDLYDSNIDSIQAFHSHRVQNLTIHPHDSKEIKAEKMKTCRQMYHSKKFSLQTVFKSLQEVGISYRRGLNSRDYLDECILSIEPLRGMIQNRSRSALRTASELVDDLLVVSCNEMYKDIVTKNQILLSQGRGDQINGEQFERIQGSTYDIVLDIIVHSRNAAAIYKHMMEIQAAASRLKHLEETCANEQVMVYKFSRVHNSIKRFNDIASRAYSSVSKLELLMDCFKTYSDVLKLENEMNSPSGTESQSGERKILRELVYEVEEKFSLMTPEQYRYLNDNLADVRKGLSEVLSELRDKLRHTIKNHLYGDDDIRQLQHLYEQFLNALNLLLPVDSDEQVNTRPGTILGSMKMFTLEAEQHLKPIISAKYFRGHLEPIHLSQHPNRDKLDIRLQKLMKQVKLATQEIYKEESEFMSTEISSETAKRKLKPFNQINSRRLLELLRPAPVANQVASCFMTLNIEDRSTNIKPIVSKIAPLMSIYTQELARYLNVVIVSVHLKLTLAKQLIPFFIDVLNHGFGLPCKIEDLEGGTEDKTNGNENDDNVGFGEGEGVNDASKKLEFESQLDELEKDSEDAGGEKGAEQDKHVDASDNGVEMSDDFDAKAQGPDDKPDEQLQSDDEDDEEINEDACELEKQFDDVDHDEGNLDKQFWDDEDEPLGEDDEEDLRQADDDPSVKPDMDQKDLKASNPELQESKDIDFKMLENQAGGDENDDEDDVDAAEKFDSEFDVPDVPDKYDQDDLDEDNQDAANPDQPNTGDNNDNDDVDIDLTQDSDNVIEDELKSGEAQKDEPEGSQNEQDSTDQDLLDMDLDPVDSDGDLSPTEERAQKLNGGDTIDDIDESDSRRDDLNELSKSEQDKQGLTAKNAEPNESESNEMDSNTEPGAHANDSSEDAEISVDDRSSKRTVADRSGIEDDLSIKRQRIEEAAFREDAGDEEKAEAGRVRHLQTDKASAIDVIDLASDSEDDVLLDSGPEKIDQQPSKPRDLKSKQEAKTGDDNEKDADKSRDESDENAPSKQQSSYNTNLGLLKYISHQLDNKEADDKTNSDPAQSDLMEQIDKALEQTSAQDDEHESLDTDRLTSLWLECTKSNGHLVHELCQQLQIVLQPTKMSKYKGDYKSGKRLNMRKIISYIASHYRKDKIWLRRTKPCKRTYNISLAVDNSSSMAENNCRQMTYQSLALLAKSLSLMEAGSLNVVSFGQQVKCIHEFDQPYVDAIGAQWLRELRFDERQTSYAQLLRYSCSSFEKQARQSLAQTSNENMNTSVNQLLIIISDGRNVNQEEFAVKSNLKQLRSQGVLTLFLIIDDLKQNNQSIMKLAKWNPYGGTKRLDLYMDSFPFPFYMVLRQMEAMPSILGDALRQWFELVSSGI